MQSEPSPPVTEHARLVDTALPTQRHVVLVGSALVGGALLGGILLVWSPTLPNERQRTAAAPPSSRPLPRAVGTANAPVSSGPRGATTPVSGTPSAATRPYTVRAGDTLLAIAEQFGTTVDAIRAANPGLNAEALRVGQEITIPGSQ